MTQAENKVEWCIRKAQKEGHDHRGLKKIDPDLRMSQGYIVKSERYLKASNVLKKAMLDDIGIGAIFYSMYHCLMAIAAKFGYESRNQECTFALIYYLIEKGKIEFDKNDLEKIAALEPKDNEGTSVKIREKYQYSTEFTVEEGLYDELNKLAKEVLTRTKAILKER